MSHELKIAYKHTFCLYLLYQLKSLFCYFHWFPEFWMNSHFQVYHNLNYLWNSAVNYFLSKDKVFSESKLKPRSGYIFSLLKGFKALFECFGLLHTIFSFLKNGLVSSIKSYKQWFRKSLKIIATINIANDYIPYNQF